MRGGSMWGKCALLILAAAVSGACNELISVASDGSAAGGTQSIAAVSSDGVHVAFNSNAPNLIPGVITEFDVFLRDRSRGVTELVSVTSAGKPAACCSGWPSISGDGRFVAFT